MQFQGKDIAAMTKEEIRFKLFLIYLFRENAKRTNESWKLAGYPHPDDDAGWKRVEAMTGAPVDFLEELRERMRVRLSWGWDEKPYPEFQRSLAASDLRRLQERLLSREHNGPERFAAGKEALEFAAKRISLERAQALRTRLFSQGVSTGERANIPAASDKEDVAIRAVWATIPAGTSSWSTAIEVLCDFLQQQQEMSDD